MDNKTCKNCGQRAESKVKFCPKCGGTEFEQDVSTVQLLLRLIGILAGIAFVVYFCVALNS